MDETDYAERIRLLESKLKAMAWIDVPCQICMERDQNTTFSCGHGACKECSERLINCHICGQTIESFSSTGKAKNTPHFLGGGGETSLPHFKTYFTPIGRPLLSLDNNLKRLIPIILFCLQCSLS